jgi:hypothetical protein
VHRPMAAPDERTLDNAPPPTPSVLDVEYLKRMLYPVFRKWIRDYLQADSERGG